MTRHPTDIRMTRTSDLAGAAFYYAHGLTFKAIETRSPAGPAFDVSLVFSGGPELEALNDAFYAGKGEVTLEQVTAFVAVLHRRLSRRGRSVATGSGQ
jgi:hypothetical protein